MIHEPFTSVFAPITDSDPHVSVRAGPLACEQPTTKPLTVAAAAEHTVQSSRHE